MCARQDQTDFARFQAARERFFETLRRDSELRRLEAAWRLAPLPPRGPERVSGEAADPACAAGQARLYALLLPKTSPTYIGAPATSPASRAPWRRAGPAPLLFFRRGVRRA